MKKTIAKIMAAAMILSAVPAVAVPTLTADAAKSTAVSISTSKDLSGDVDSDGDTGADIDGYSSNDKGVAVTYRNWYSSKTSENDYDVVFQFGSNDAGVDISGTKKYLEDVVEASIVDGDVYLSLDTSESGYGKVLAAAVKDAKNYVTIYADFQYVEGRSINGTAMEENKTTPVTLGEFRIGGDVDTTANKIIKTGIRASGDDNSGGQLRDGDVWAQITDDTNLCVELLKTDKDGVLDDNDDLRGATLDVTTVDIGGVTYKVTKLGSQVFKKAHMKKFYAENAKKIGKGALRKAKQVKKVDIEDGQKVRKIHEKAFYDCKNLNTIIIDGRKLSTIGKNAFHGVKKNCTVKIKAKKSKYESDKKMILKNGGNKNLKFVRK
ncbi:MAG: leucine-rich repeat protein [Lachnospiraceae bacterium]|nr:leucine-rich repeat protein [Lachnospiraceae bacterium]